MKKLIPLLLCVLLLTACDWSIPPAPTDPLPTIRETQEVTEPMTDPVTEPETTTVTVYYGNDNADGFETIEVQLPGLSEELLVKELIACGALTEDVVLYSTELREGCLYLDFSEGFRNQIFTYGTSGEYIMVGSVVNTFLTAYPDAETVYITVEGGILESGHVIYDEPMGFFD